MIQMLKLYLTTVLAYILNKSNKHGKCKQGIIIINKMFIDIAYKNIYNYQRTFVLILTFDGRK